MHLFLRFLREVLTPINGIGYCAGKIRETGKWRAQIPLKEKTVPAISMVSIQITRIRMTPGTLRMSSMIFSSTTEPVSTMV